MSNLSQQYRPQHFAEIKGQAHIARVIEAAIRLDRIGHAYLFAGPRGTGKTTLARLLARAANCANRNGSEACGKCESCQAIAKNASVNIIEIDAASYTGVDNIRQIRDEVRTPPVGAPYKIYIIDEVHMLSKGAFNALLKTLEEPPAHAIFILATTELHKVPDTVRSRAQEFAFSRLPHTEIAEKLESIAKKEKAKIDKQAIQAIALSAEGGMRDAESLFSQVLAMAKDKKSVALGDIEAFLGIAGDRTVAEFAEALFFETPDHVLGRIDALVDTGNDPEVFTKQLVVFLRAALRRSAGVEETSTAQETLEHIARDIPTSRLLASVEFLAASLAKAKTAFLPQLPLEIAAVKISTENGEGKTEKGKNGDEERDKNDSDRQTQATSDKDASDIQTRVTSDKEGSNKTTQVTGDKEEQSLSLVTGHLSQDESLVTSHKSQDKSPAAKPAKESKQPKKSSQSAANSKLSSTTLDSITSQWPAFLEKTKSESLSFSLLFSNAAPIRIENGDTLVLSARYALHRDKINEQKTRLTAESILATLLGASVKMVCLSDEESGHIRGGEKSKAPSEDASGDETLAGALEVFGANA